MQVFAAVLRLLVRRVVRLLTGSRAPNLGGEETTPRCGRMTLDAFALEIMESAKRQLRDDGSVLAAVFIDGPKPFILGLDGFPRTPEERRAFFFELGQKMARGQPTHVLMVFDGWMKETDDELLDRTSSAMGAY